mmetsp:Transcript_6077/g.7852  ORF Transcript_6077/g.7852 Transcript_6077/m.7852 type:complete len:136 (-) Transcript_6077:319-726(-)|eukprot:CAMPEP_0198139758 /NCGR_PEP_ID=MMETSP1443-20131203/2999_1 /TAXON_ID=186043 /ORGANISM="Entomoneis sp., Strain CCMP2396" /LENGTH=135 /DNA_ID=CAMNT_0043801969 /DNA_START=73 /DNA_END=483 /DNA_ORIENTATION=-
MPSPPPSISDILTAMAEAVEMDASIRKRFNAVVLFEIKDKNDNSTSKTLLLDARKGPPSSISNKDNPKPDLQVTTSVETLQDLLGDGTTDKKPLTPQQAFMKGKLKIKGKMGLAMKLKLVLDATRKHLAVTTSRL